MKGKKGSIGTATHIPRLTPKQRGQVFSEEAEREKEINDIRYWRFNSFGELYHKKYRGVKCPENIRKILLKKVGGK